MSYTTTCTTDETKMEESNQYSWQQNRASLPIPSHARSSMPYESPHTSSSMISPYHGLSSSYRPMYTTHQLPSQPITNREPPSAPLRPSLTTSHSFPSLKRPYRHAAEDSSFGEHSHDPYESIIESESSSKPSINPDHRLLSFARLQDRHTVLDQHGRQRSLEITAQLHGMFFLSEIATNAGDMIIVQPELTCYRRNLFQITGQVTGPSGPLSILDGRGEPAHIVSQELAVSAMESVDNAVIRLIVIPWKTPPPNAPEPQVNQEQEPLAIPIFQGVNNQDMNTDLTVQPISWRRLQFRVATANNGRRKELQQHFVLRLTLTATLADGSKVVTAECSTAPIVVRGRSPRNFQTRKEIPLLGSSAASRGQTSLSPPPRQEPSHVPERTRVVKPTCVEMPKKPFQFDASHFPPSPLLLRNSHGYNSWTTSQADHNTATTPNYPPPHHLLPGYGHVLSPGSDTSSVHTPTLTSPSSYSGTESSRAQYYTSSTAPMPLRGLPYHSSSSSMDSNPRPSKSPRHTIPPDLSSSEYPGFEQRLGSHSSFGNGSEREYFPPIIPQPQPVWTSAEQSQVLYPTSMPPPPPQHYAFPGEVYVKAEPVLSSHYTWNQ